MRRAVAVAVTLFGLGCEAPFTFPAPVAKVIVTPDSAALTAGDRVHLAAAAVDSSGAPVTGLTFTWVSSDEFLATVSADGWVETLRPGRVTISAYAQGVSDSAPISIAVRIVGLRIEPGALSLVPAGSLQFGAIGFDPDGRPLYGRPMHWATDDSSVLTVSPTGLVTTLRAGTAALIVTFDSLRTQVPITVRQVRFVSIDASEADHTCGISTDSLAWCWGQNALGQLGVGSVTTSPAPIAVFGHRQYVAVTTGGNFTCAIDAAGAPYCWGSSARGRLGAGAQITTPIPTPVAVSTEVAVTSIAAGWNHACALAPAGDASVECWGEDPAAGNPALKESAIPYPVASGISFTALASGVGFGCGLAAGGAAFCWGANPVGQLGTDSVSTSAIPVAVRGGLAFTAITAGGAHACGLAADGTASCWGENAAGQLGTGDSLSRAAPAPVAGGLHFIALAAGGASTCGVEFGGAVYCWGHAGSTVPAAVPGAPPLSTITVGNGHVCGIGVDGRAYCWGANAAGQLGDGTYSARAMPAPVAGQASAVPTARRQSATNPRPAGTHRRRP